MSDRPEETEIITSDESNPIPEFEPCGYQIRNGRLEPVWDESEDEDWDNQDAFPNPNGGH